MKGRSGTSFREQVIFYYIQQFFSDAVNRFNHEDVGELDIYVPSINVAVEYDGSRWHKNKLDIDNEKNQRAKNSGIRLIRIREFTLSPTEDVYGEIYLPKDTHNLYDVTYLTQIFCELGSLIKNASLCQYRIDEDDYKRDLPKIYCRIYDVPVEDNLADMCGIELWDKGYNGELSPLNIPSKEWAYAILRCKNGNNIELPRYHREFKNSCRSEYEKTCDNCIAGIICPLIKWCAGKNGQIIECPVVNDAVHRLIDKGHSYRKMELSSCLSDWLWKRSTLGIELVGEILSLEKNDPLKKKYFQFFGFITEENGVRISSDTIFVRNDDEKKLVERLADELPYTKLTVYVFPR